MLLLAAGILLVFSLWTGIVLHLQQVKEQELTQSRRDVTNLSIALSEQVSRLLDSVDEILRLVQRDFADPDRSFDADKWMNEVASLKNVASQVAVFSESGDLKAQRLPLTNFIRPNISDRDYFKALKQDPGSGLVIGRTVVGRLSGQRTFVLARALLRSDGSFAGVFVVALDPDDMGRKFRALDMELNGSIALIGTDGFARVRSPEVPGMYELDARVKETVSGVFSELKGAPAGTFEADCVFDGRHRIFGYRKIESYPLFVQTGKDLDAILLPYRREFNRVVIGGGAITTLFLALGLVLIGESEARRLQQEMLVEANKAITASENGFRLFAETTKDIIIQSNLEQRRLYISPASLEILGYTPEELTGTLPGPLVHPDDWPAYKGILDALCQGRREQATSCQRYLRRDGAWVWIETSLSVTRGSDGSISGYIASLRDITARREAEEALRISEERLTYALDSGSDGLWDLDFSNGRAWVSSQWCRMLGYSAEETSALPGFWKSILHPEDATHARRMIQSHLKGATQVYESEHRLRRQDGQYVWVLTRGKVVEWASDGRAKRMVGTQIDISARKKAESQLEHMALHDALTGLPNRTLFRKRLEAAAERFVRTGAGFAVLLADLDQFKTINDTYGHPAGDALLCTITERLGSLTGENDTVARLGGDEFAIILGSVDGPHDAEAVAARAIEVIDRPIEIAGRTTTLGVSIGIALASERSPEPDELLKNADIALYQAKAAGRHTYSTYEPGMAAAIEARNAIELDLKDAIARREFLLHYQPIQNAQNGSLVGFEALMRWDHPSRGLVAPATFIPVAEETGLITAMGQWALFEACREASTWPDPIRVAVNVSAVQFRQEGLESCVVDALACSGLPAERLELEITESVLIQDGDAVVASLHRLKSLGVRIALDDFGTGYSSLSYLGRFPFDKIKIDRSFVRAISDPMTSAIVHSVVGLAERLGATVTAEGVETQKQLKLARRQGCSEIQGYLYSKPLDAVDAFAFLQLNAKASQSATAA